MSMKVDSGLAGSNTATVLHKVKVKEEAKECCGFRQASSPTSSPTSGVTTIATSVTCGTTVTTTPSNANGDAATTVVASSPTTTSHPSSVNASNVTACPEDRPVDLELKVKAKAACGPREKGVVREEGGHRDTNSPSSQHQVRGGPASSTSSSTSSTSLSSSTGAATTVVGPTSSVPQASNGPRVGSEHGKSRHGSRSPADENSPNGQSALKPEHEDGSRQSEEQQQQQQQQPIAAEGSAPLNGGGRCVRAVFAGHGKLKRLLGTLVQFAGDISHDTGDTVRTLILALLSGSMTAEEFHSALQEATNFPLRGFVLPYLKHTLPSLQRDLNNAARANNQSCAQYLRSNESAVLESVGLVPSGETVEIFGEHGSNGLGSTHYAMRSNSNPGIGAIQHANSTAGPLLHYSSPAAHAPKRRASDTPYYENGAILDDGPVYGKRSNPWNHHHHQQQQAVGDTSSSYCWYHPLHSTGGSVQGHAHAHNHGPSPVPPSLVQINQINAFGTHHVAQQQQSNHSMMQNGASLDDEWKNIHVMLNCILGMVEKTKRALAILQRRGCSSPAGPPPQPAANVIGAQNGNNTGNNNPSSTNGVQVESSTGDRDGNLKRLSGEIVAQTIRATEDRVAEVKRRAEEAVLEVKRAAVAEVQRAVAVAVAESRANERLRVHRLLDLPLAQRTHSGLRQGPFLRVHGASGAVDANTRSVTTPTTTSNPLTSTTEEEKETHLSSVSGSSCWNCGRPALETCGGCGIARYCGSFCQHRDWEAGGHHATCNNPAPHRGRSASRSPPRITTGSLPSSANDADIGAAPIAPSTVSKGK